MTSVAQISPPPAPSPKLPCALIVVIVCCFLRGAMSLWFVSQMFRYISSGSFGIYQYMFTSLAEAVAWIILGFGLWRLKASARLGAMIFCGIILAWSSYLFLSAMLHRTLAHWNFPLFIFNIVSDFAIIAYLAQSNVKKLFETTRP